MLIAFIAWETIARAPMLDVSLFRQRTFTGSSIAAFGLSMAVLGPVLCLVVYMSFDQGYSELTIGTHLLLLTGVTLPFLPLTGFLDKYVPVRLLICGGLVLVATGLWLMSRLSAAGSLSELVPGLIVAGVGLELVNPRLAYAAAATVRPAIAAAASRTISTFRQIGIATGIAVFGAIFATQLNDHISERTAGFPQLANENPSIASLVLDGHTAQAVSSAPAAVRSQIVPIIHTGFAGAVHDVFFVAAFVALASAVLALSTRSSDVPRTGASQLRSQSSVSDGLGIEATPGRTTAPSANGARPEPAVAAAPEPETSTAATLAALGITVATTPQPDELTRIDELTVVGELARLRELAAVATEAWPPQPTGPRRTGPDALATETCCRGLAPTHLSRKHWPPTRWPATRWSRSTCCRGTGPRRTGHRARGGSHAPVDRKNPGSAGMARVGRVAGTDAGRGRHRMRNRAMMSARSSMRTCPWRACQRTRRWQSHGDRASGRAARRARRAAGGRDGGGPPVQPRRWVRGQVTAATGEPLAGALVTLVTADGDEAGHAIAGSDGSFAVGDMRDGTYTLIAAAPHFRPAASTFALSSEEAPVMIYLLGIGSMTGKVTTAKDGSPMSVDLELLCPDGDVAAQYRTGKDGRFSLTDLVEGSYELVVRHAGYRTAEVPVLVDRAQTLTIEVALVGVGHLYGAVTGPGGGWVPGVQVTLSDGTGTVVATTGTDGAGSFRFSEIPEGPYTVCATAFGAVLLGSGGRGRFDRCRRRQPRLALRRPVSSKDGIDL